MSLVSSLVRLFHLSLSSGIGSSLLSLFFIVLGYLTPAKSELDNWMQKSDFLPKFYCTDFTINLSNFWSYLI